ncbi:hypothetical protein THAOC_33089, partial [Thalassiosira oceanica]
MKCCSALVPQELDGYRELLRKMLSSGRKGASPTSHKAGQAAGGGPTGATTGTADAATNIASFGLYIVPHVVPAHYLVRLPDQRPPLPGARPRERA